MPLTPHSKLPAVPMLLVTDLGQRLLVPRSVISFLLWDKINLTRASTGSSPKEAAVPFPLTLGKQQKHQRHPVLQAARAKATSAYPEVTNLGVKPAAFSFRASACLDAKSMGQGRGDCGMSKRHVASPTLFMPQPVPTKLWSHSTL